MARKAVPGVRSKDRANNGQARREAVEAPDEAVPELRGEGPDPGGPGDGGPPGGPDPGVGGGGLAGEPAAVVWKGPEALRALLVPISEITQDPRNVRLHPARNLEAIAGSLGKFGQRKPIVTREGIAVAGNGTHEAALSLGWTHLALVGAEDLSPDEARAYAIMDNKSGELAEWDYQGLGAAFAELPQELLQFTGFADFEIGPLRAADWAPPQATDGDGGYDRVTFVATADQGTTIRRAIEAVRANEGDRSITDGRALELVCAEFLSGN